MGGHPLIAPSSALAQPKMGLRDLLSPPRMGRRARSEARGEVGPIEAAQQVYPAAQHHAGSTPDLEISPSTLLPSGPSTSQDQRPSSTQMNFYWKIRLTTFFTSRRPSRHLRSNPIRFQDRTKPGLKILEAKHRSEHNG